MAMKFSGSLVLILVTASVFATAIANKTLQAGECPPCPCFGWGCWNITHEPQTVVVGGSEHWHFGFDYAHWAFNQSWAKPFFVGDTLVFKYTTEHQHNVVLLRNFHSFNSCDVATGKVIGEPNDGIKGVEFKLTAKQPGEDPFFYFACSEGNGVHCSIGMMKFAVFPWPNSKKEKLF